MEENDAIVCGVEKAVAQAAPVEGSMPKRCRSYVQYRMARFLPEMVNALEMKARRGDVSVARLLWQMSGMEDESAGGKQSAESTLSRLLMERLNEYEGRR